MSAPADQQLDSMRFVITPSREQPGTPSQEQPKHSEELPDSLTPPHLLDDVAADNDSLGLRSVAIGSAKYLMNPGTGTSAFAIYGRWGQGKSTFMRLLEQELVCTAAKMAVMPSKQPRQQSVTAQQQQQCSQMQGQVEGQPTRQQKVVRSFIDRLDPLCSDRASRADVMAALKRIAQPNLVCTWFNTWQYMNEQQVWAGLVVETVQAVEAALPPPQRWLLAWRYHLCMRPGQVCMQLLLPVVVWAMVVFGLVVFGIVQLQSCLRCSSMAGMCITNELAKYSAAAPGSLISGYNTTAPGSPPAAGSSTSPNITAAGSAQGPRCFPVLATWLSVLVGVVGTLLVLLVTVNRVEAIIKPLSAAISDKLKYLSLPDHSHHTGYQHEAIRDLRLLRALLQWRWHACGFFAALLGLWLQAVCTCMACACFCCYDCSWALQSSEAPHIRDRRVAWCNALLPTYSTLMGASGVTNTKLIVFIDDLDRVPPGKVVEVLAAVNLILTAAGITTVIGMDKQVVLAALSAHCATVEGVQDTAELYLEKIVQVSLTLAAPSPGDYHQYLLALGLAEQEVTKCMHSYRFRQACARTTQYSHNPHSAAANFSQVEQIAAHKLLAFTQLRDLTPRTVKRFLNHHYLARFLLAEADLVQPPAEQPELQVNQGEFHDLLVGEEAAMTYCQLMGWLFMWTAYPEGMRVLLKYHDLLSDKNRGTRQLATMMWLHESLREDILPVDEGSVQQFWLEEFEQLDGARRKTYLLQAQNRLQSLDLLQVTKAAARAASQVDPQRHFKLAGVDQRPTEGAAPDAAASRGQPDQQRMQPAASLQQQCRGSGGNGSSRPNGSGAASSSSSSSSQQTLTWLPAGPKARSKAIEQLAGVLDLLESMTDAKNSALETCLNVKSRPMQLFIKTRFHMEFVSDQIIAGPKEPEPEQDKLVKLVSAGTTAVLEALGKAEIAITINKDAAA